MVDVELLIRKLLRLYLLDLHGEITQRLSMSEYDSSARHDTEILTVRNNKSTGFGMLAQMFG